MAFDREHLAATSPVTQAHALQVFGDLDSLKVVESSMEGEGYQATVRIPEMASSRGQMFFQSAAPSLEQAEALAIEPLIRMYRVKKALWACGGSATIPFSSRPEEFRLLHLFLIHLRMQLGHNTQAVLDLDTALVAEVTIGCLDLEELCEAVQEALAYNRELRHDLTEELTAIWQTYSAAAHASL
ncbi:g9558 [Coccomyxa viridis]|uniref:G9558 protein n=1 Tax=Coccomyxa viridis TaxID=1274662 RepID=A0ABP1G3J8_9CHLO